MGEKAYFDELERALTRPDGDQMRRQLLDYARYNSGRSGEWPGDLADDFEEIVTCHFEDPIKHWRM
jgi:hypothetical protein